MKRSQDHKDSRVRSKCTRAPEWQSSQKKRRKGYMDEMEKGKEACYNQIGEEKATILVPVAQHLLIGLFQ